MKMIAVLAFIAFLSAHSSFPTPERVDRHELFCLAQAVHWEARGEPPLGQVAVAHVVLNRVRSSLFPDTVCEVVHQPRQFTDIPADYSPEGPSWEAGWNGPGRRHTCHRRHKKIFSHCAIELNS